MGFNREDRLRIVVCNAQVPFVWGGAESLADALVARLRDAGHQVEPVRLPFRYDPKGEILKSYLAWRLLDLSHSECAPIDRLIALKFPAYVAPHPHKTTWLIQQFRQAYDLYGTAYSPLDTSPADVELRRAIVDMDTRCIAESRRILAISGRLRQYNGLTAETLYPPPALEERLYAEAPGDYVFSLSRLNRMKRLDRLVRAMGRVRSGVRCRIAGRGEELEPLQRLARQVGAAERVQFLGFVSDEETLALYAHALAVYYAPYDEDYGLVTVEAFKAGRAMLTTADAGGVLEFVEDGLNGYVAPCDDDDVCANALAERLDALYADRALAARLGASGAERVRGITWAHALDRLLEA
jgi:glycosyltransferase involved in cell wall biosynthesis